MVSVNHHNNEKKTPPTTPTTTPTTTTTTTTSVGESVPGAGGQWRAAAAGHVTNRWWDQLTALRRLGRFCDAAMA